MAKYRYRQSRNECGVTSKALARMRLHLRKIGCPLLVRAYRFQSARRHDYQGEAERVIMQSREAVMVKGTRGSARFEGFCWGYGGEGPRGLRNLLLMLGVPIGAAEKLAFGSTRKYDHGTDWEYKVPRSFIPVWQL